MAKGGPGKAYREGISLMELADMFPDEEAATKWFEGLIWPNGQRHCPRCGSTETSKASSTSSGLPYYCPACKRAFSVRIGTALERSKVPLRKWVFAIYLEMTSLKGVSSMKLHRDLKVTQKTAWFMLHRIKEALQQEQNSEFGGPTEADETYFGGRESNKHASKKLRSGRGTVGKTTVAGIKDRATGQIMAEVVPDASAKTLHGFVTARTEGGSTVYTDDAAAYKGLKSRTHESIKHSVGEYVRDMAHTNGIESFWAMLKRAHKGTFHKISPKHLNRYVHQFAGKHNIRKSDTIDQMENLVSGMVGKRLMYRDLVA